MKMKKMGILILLILAGCTGSLVTWYKYSTASEKSYHINEQKIIEANKISSLQIDTNSINTHVIVQNNNQENIKLYLTGKVGNKKDIHFSSKLDHGRLKVEAKYEDSFKISKNESELELKIFVPIQLANLRVSSLSGNIKIKDINCLFIDINTKSGDINMGGIVAKNDLLLKTSSGNIVIDKSIAGNSKMKTNSGDMMISNVETQTLHVESSSGDININSKKIKNSINIQTNSGNIYLNSQEKPNDIKLDFSSHTGEVSIVNIDNFNYTIQKENHIQGVIGSGRTSVKAKSKSGNLNFSSSK
jgi:lia operon protein LiaG